MITQYTIGRSQWVNTREYIMLHHTGWVFPTDLNRLTYSGQVSCHYYIAQSGDVYKLANDDWITRHAGESQYDGRSGFNQYAIGIEIESLDWHTFTDTQRDAVELLVGSLVSSYDIPCEKIITHAMASGFRGKWDVWPNFFDRRWGYENFISLFDTKMTEKQKRHLVRSLMDTNSALYDEVQDETLKDLLSQVNTRLRELWFDNTL